MSSPLSSRPSDQEARLLSFTSQFSDLAKDLSVDKVQEIACHFLDGKALDSLSPSAPKLTKRIQKLYCMFTTPILRGGAGEVAIQALKAGMRKVLEDKLVDCQIASILKQAPSCRIPYFKSTVEGFYSKFLAEGKTPQEALHLSLVKGLMRLLVNLPTKEEISRNVELIRCLEADPDLQKYSCVIQRDNLMIDAVYLRADKDGKPLEYYHDEEIKNWIRENGTDPITREGRTPEDIKPAHKVRELVEKKIFSILYSEFFEGITSSTNVEALESKVLLLAIDISYPLVKAVYEGALQLSVDPLQALREAEAYAQKVISEITSIVGDLSLEEKEIAPSTFPYVEEFIWQSGARLSEGAPLEKVREDFERKLRAFIPFFHQIKGKGLSPDLEEAVLKRGEQAIREGSRYEEAVAGIELYLDSVGRQEEHIRALYPNALIGAQEWSKLGVVESIPIPPGVLEILSRPSISIEGQEKGARIGDTHVLVLIPGEVDGAPLTINSLGMLLKNKGYFPDTEAGFPCSWDHAFLRYGEERAKPHWVLMSRGVIEGSRNKEYAAEQAQLGRLREEFKLPYKVPTLFEAIACSLMVYVASEEKIRLFSKTYTWCEEQVWADSQLLVGRFDSSGLRIGSYARSEIVGVAAALREFTVLGL